MGNFVKLGAVANSKNSGLKQIGGYMILELIVSQQHCNHL